MINEQVIPIDIGMGLDTKTDPKEVVAGKLIRLENGVFTKAKSIEKRNGYSSLPLAIVNGGNLISPQLVGEFNGEIICADGGNLYSFSNSMNAWVPKNKYISTDVSRFTVDSDVPASGYADSAVLGNFILYGWSSIGNSGNSFNVTNSGQSVFISVVDSNTNTTIYKSAALSTSNTSEEEEIVRCVTLGGTQLAVFYTQYNGAAPCALVARLITVSGVNITVGPEIVVSIGFSTNVNGTFDIAQTATGAVLSYSGEITAVDPAFSVITIDTSAAITHTSTILGQAGTHVNPDPANGHIWFYYYDGASIKYTIYNSDLTVFLATQVISNDTPTTLVALKINSALQHLFTGSVVSSGGGTIGATLVYAVPNVPSGIIPSSLFENGIVPWSRPFQVTGNVGTILGQPTSYMVFLYSGIPGPIQSQATQQPTFFVVLINPELVSNSQYAVARLAYGLANSWATTLVGGNTPINIPSVGANKFVFIHSESIQEFRSPTFVDGETLNSVFATTIDFNSPRAYLTKSSGDLALLNGGVVQAYDGNVCAEFGFHLFPEITGITQSTQVGGGLVSGKTYHYMAIYQWTDAQGNLHQSAPSEVISVTITGANNTATIYVSAPYLSQKPNVGIAIFRTPDLSSGGGTQFFQVSDPAFPLIVTSTNAYVSFNDGLTDVQLDTALQPYTYPASSVLENSTPPPSMILLSHNNRLWFVDAENPNTEWYTKSFEPGVGLSPSAFMTQQIDPKFGNIAALAEMDEKIITFKDNGIFVQSGDGLNDAGSGSTLSFPQFVPSDVGCSSLKSVVLTPSGVMFKSPNGIYRIDRALSVEYVGAEVEAYNAQTITDARIIQGKSQIRFLCSSGLALVYDYIFSQWSTFTNHTGVCATLWKGVYVYINSSGVILKETTNHFLDDATPFSLLIQTSWLALATIQGFQRVRRVAVLGDFSNGASANHGVQVTATYDFQVSPVIGPIPFVFGAKLQSGVIQYRERLVQQKCGSLSLLIEEVVTGDAAEYVVLTDLSFEAAVKKGLRKMGQSVTVG